MTVWINARDNLPDKSGLFLVYIRVPDGWDRDEYDTSFLETASYDERDGLWRVNDSADFTFNAYLEHVDTKEAYYVSHWMPMPEPPDLEGETL